MTADTAAPCVPIEALFLRFRERGDAGALAALFDRTAPSLFRVALTVAPDAATAEEAVQETFLAVLEDPRRCDLSKPLMPWLVAVLRHKVLDVRRRERRVPDLLRLEPRLLPEDPADAAARKEAVDRVRAAIERLEEPYRTVALLRWEYGLEPGEIAHVRDEPPGTVRSTLSRALQRLRKELGGASALALVLGARPASGLRAVRDRVLAKAGPAPAGAASAAGIAVGGAIVNSWVAATILGATFLAGGLAGLGFADFGGGDESPARHVVAPGPPGPEVVPAPRAPRAHRLEITHALETRGASASISAAGATQVQAEGLLARLDGTWSTAWKVGQDLARLEPADAVLELLRERWTELGRAVDRQNLMKGFSFDAANPLRVEVFHLGAEDPDPRVRHFALSYLEPYAGRRLVDDPTAYDVWRTTAMARSPAELLEESAGRLFDRLRAAREGERADLLDLLDDVVDRRGSRVALPAGAFDAALGWLEDPTWAEDPRPLLRVIAASTTDEVRAREVFERLVRRGREGQRRALLLAGELEARWAAGILIERLRHEDPAIVEAAATALADLQDIGSVGPLVGALAARPDGPASGALARALERLTGIDRWMGRDARWWQAWWARNREAFEAAAREEDQ